MVNIPVLRWGQPYTSMESDSVVHFITGETLAKVSQANPGLLAKDIRKAPRARDLLREIPCRELIQMMKKAADFYRDGTLPMGDGSQSPDDFARQQSASTGLPEHMCKAIWTKTILCSPTWTEFSIHSLAASIWKSSLAVTESSRAEFR